MNNNRSREVQGGDSSRAEKTKTQGDTKGLEGQGRVAGSRDWGEDGPGRPAQRLGMRTMAKPERRRSLVELWWSRGSVEPRWSRWVRVPRWSPRLGDSRWSQRIYIARLSWRPESPRWIRAAGRSHWRRSRGAEGSQRSQAEELNDIIRGGGSVRTSCNEGDLKQGEIRGDDGDLRLGRTGREFREGHHPNHHTTPCGPGTGVWAVLHSMPSTPLMHPLGWIMMTPWWAQALGQKWHLPFDLALAPWRT